MKVQQSGYTVASPLLFNPSHGDGSYVLQRMQPAAINLTVTLREPISATQQETLTAWLRQCYSLLEGIQIITRQQTKQRAAPQMAPKNGEYKGNILNTNGETYREYEDDFGKNAPARDEDKGHKKRKTHTRETL